MSHIGNYAVLIGHQRLPCQLGFETRSFWNGSKNEIERTAFKMFLELIVPTTNDVDTHAWPALPEVRYGSGQDHLLPRGARADLHQSRAARPQRLDLLASRAKRRFYVPCMPEERGTINRWGNPARFPVEQRNPKRIVRHQRL